MRRISHSSCLGASFMSARASLRLTEPFRLLPRTTPTFRMVMSALLRDRDLADAGWERAQLGSATTDQARRDNASRSLAVAERCQTPSRYATRWSRARLRQGRQ